jgi:gamma-glutamyltranspeptidase/glutathione hydrolase
VPGRPNSIAPRKRPRTTLSPSMVLRDGKPWMAFGTSGGDQQDQWQPVMLLRMLHHNMSIQEAIDTPNFHAEHWPSSFWPRAARPARVVLEARYDRGVLDDLIARGHRAEMGAEWSEGRLSGARIEPDGQMFAGANPRGMQGYAVGR